MTPAAGALTVAVHAYRYGLRPIIGSHCRFHPHCSDYALEALASHGAARGTWLTARRILRCHPWNPGGWDPVPPAPRPSGTSSPSGISPSGAPTARENG